jgi:hypothetical protein
MSWYLALVGVVLIGMMAMINLMTDHLIAKLDDMQRRYERMERTLDAVNRDIGRRLAQ